MNLSLAHSCQWDLDRIWWGEIPFWALFGDSHSPNASSLQVCLCVAANVAYSLQQNVLYVDSNGGLTASRLLQLLQARTPDEEEQVRAGGLSFFKVPTERPHYPLCCLNFGHLDEQSFLALKPCCSIHSSCILQVSR